MARKRIPKYSIFIACEGSNTEPLYFEKISEIMQDGDDYPFSITVYPDREEKSAKTDALGLVKVAIERKEKFDEVWAVFDKDGYTKHSEAFALASLENVNIAFSSISFETWILMHYERCSKSFSKSMGIIASKFFEKSYLPDYAKSGNFNLYPEIQPIEDVAFKNAAWLRNLINKECPGLPIYDSNPYTDVDNLVRKIRQVNDVYGFRYLGDPFCFNGVEVVANEKKGEIIVAIKNSLSKSIVTNEFNFFNSAREKIDIKNKVIEPGKQEKIKLGKISSSTCICIEYENLKLEIEF
ncbi:RloB family protein [Elizabethkingia anophelis]|uniref:RloB family protein n=1 Tax=Elizabethkingia anophelis TaxID=1117645 RepID=UPI0037870250